jgi:receptor protein-tyrosine kinase
LRGLEDLARSAPLPPAPSEEAAAAQMASQMAPLSPATAFVPPPPIEFAVLEQAGMIPWGRKRDRVAEEFRLVQSQVLRQLDAAAKSGPQGTSLPNLVMITSARPNEGKSFVSLNLAASIAHFGSRQVLLVDADAKHTSLSHHLNLAEQPGLLDFGAGLMPRPETLIVPTRVETLSILPIGGVGPGRGDLAAKVAIATAIERLARRFAPTVIVLDAPPCLSTSDPSALAPVVGQTVFVIEAERTRRGEVESSLDLIAACPTITLLLNKSQLTTNSTFGAYYY